jgi:hypothetical protein
MNAPTEQDGAGRWAVELAEALPHLAGLRIARVEALADELNVDVVADGPEAPCPAWRRPARRPPRHGGERRAASSPRIVYCD